jgi:hypothetical protein
MIPNHQQFIDAIQAKTKVFVRFYSVPDSGVKDLTCAPLDYGPGPEVPSGLHRYWLWDYASNTGTHILHLAPEQIVNLQVLGSVFAPAEFGTPARVWSIPRDWGMPSAAVAEK